MKTIDIPKFGKVTVSVERTPGEQPVIYVLPDERLVPVDHRDRRLKSKYKSVVKYPDPCRAKPSYVIRKQKVVVLKLTEQELEELRDEKNRKRDIRAISGNRSKQLDSFNKVGGRITVSDCPNPLYERSSIQKRTYTVLLEWTESTFSRFPELELRNSNGGLIDLISQTNNYFVISPTDPENPPGHPVAGAGRLNMELTDYKPLTEADLEHYKNLNHNKEYADWMTGPTVAVVDTGLKFNFNNPDEESLPDPYTYPAANGRNLPFILPYQEENNAECQGMQNNHIGYCSLNGYTQQEFADETKDRLNLNTCTIEDVRNSPYDDHRILGGPDSKTLLDGRHGTIIAAIIQQRKIPILPVKAFDNLGFSTLFDILNALNYVLQRHKADNIRVVNASWIFGRDEPLLLDKIRQLMQAGIFVVAAAGNRRQTADRNLDNVPVYPACYSTQCPNVITVTSVTKTYSSLRTELKDKTTSSDDKFELALSNPEVRSDLIGETNPGVAVPALYRVAGYTAVENYSNRFVNVGVVSTFGYFSSPFRGSGPQVGSSFACAYVSAFIAEQFKNNKTLLPSEGPVTDTQMSDARQQILNAMDGTDTQLGLQAVAQGHYLMS